MGETGHTDSTRSCVGCRQTEPREALMRFVVAGDPPTLVADVRRRAPGRGASVHPRFRCVDAAVLTGGFRRALGVNPGEARDLASAAASQYERRAQGLLLAAQRSKNLAIGTEAVRDALTERRVRMLVVAKDAGGSRQDLTDAAARLGKSCLVWSNKEDLGKLFGRTTLSILAVLDQGIADELASVFRCATELSEDS